MNNPHLRYTKAELMKKMEDDFAPSPIEWEEELRDEIMAYSYPSSTFGINRRVLKNEDCFSIIKNRLSQKREKMVKMLEGMKRVKSLSSARFSLTSI